MNLNEDLLSPPFVYTRHGVFTANIFIIVCLLIQLLALLFEGDFYSALNILFSVLGCIAVDFFAQEKKYARLNFNISALTIGLLIGFFMPSQIGFVFAFIISAFSFFLTKIVFGGIGSNWANPIAFAICIAYISRQDFFPASLNLEVAKNYGGLLPVFEQLDFAKLKIDFSLTSVLNSIFLHSVGVTLQEGYLSLFYNSGAAIPAFRYSILTLISSIVLFAFRIIDYILPVSFLLSYGLLIWIFGGYVVSGTYFSGDILFALLTSGILFSAIFVMSESSSAPKTKYGKILCGILNGVFAFLICRQGASPAGIAFVIILGNTITPFIEKIEKQMIRKKRAFYE